MIIMTGIILSGGKSRRIGENKAFLKIGEKYIIQMVVESLKSVVEKIIVVTDNPYRYKFLRVKIVKDIIPGKGSLGGIYTGLFYSKDYYNFICGCDMPFLNPDLVRFMRSTIKDNDVVVPVVGGFLEPLHSIYSKRCIGVIRQHLKKDDLKIKNFFPEVRCIYLSEGTIRRYDPNLLSFFNLNTPKMLELIKNLHG